MKFAVVGAAGLTVAERVVSFLCIPSCSSSADRCFFLLSVPTMSEETAFVTLFSAGPEIRSTHQVRTVGRSAGRSLGRAVRAMRLGFCTVCDYG